MRVLGDGVDAEPLADLVEEHVARARPAPRARSRSRGRRVRQQRKVRLPKKSPPPQKMRGERRDDALLERRRRHHDLVGRARRIRALHALAVERPLLVVDERLPLGEPDAAREDVRDRTPAGSPSRGSRRCAGRARRSSRRARPCACSAVCCRSRSIVRTRLLPGVSSTSRQHAQLAADRVDLDLLAAVDAAQVVLPVALRARLSRSGRRGGSRGASRAPAG